MRIFLFFVLFNLHAQDVLDNSSQSAVSPTLANESIKTISPTKRIFIITNNEASFGKGDFISLLLDGDLVARALVAKDDQKLSGIKILKIYSLSRWSTLRPNLSVQVLRGDDGYYRKQETVAEAQKEDELTVLEDKDLFDSAVLADDLILDDNSKRLLKQDNIIGLSYGRLQAVDSDQQSESYDHFMFHWAYQVADNVWAEGLVGQSLITNYPQSSSTAESSNLDTRVTNFTLRLKLTIEGPLFSYFLPYAGIQVTDASSPGAGDTTNTTVNSEELQQVENLKDRGVIFGVTVLKRLVPGWFIKADLGNDIIGAGLSLEF